MPIIKETIRNNGQDVTLKFDLGINNRLSGYQQEIDELTEDTKEELINPVIDYEVDRFKHQPSNVSVLTFSFSNSAGTDTDDDFEYAGFTESEIEDADDVMLNSFFIMDFFDTYDNYTQTKILTIYNTQVLEGETSGGVPIPKYYVRDSTINQFFYLYVPKSFLDTQTGTTITGYSKFSFYNAIEGRVSLFYNPNESSSSPKRMYFRTFLYPNTMQWKFENYSMNPTELSPNNTYVNRVNDAVDSFENLQQAPQEGAFDPTSGKYDDPISRRPSTRGSTRTTGGSTGGRTVGDRDLGTSTPR